MMLYIKRIFILVLMLALAWMNYIMSASISSKLTIQVIGYCIINILLVCLMVYAYHISKAITRNIFIMISEYIIMILLIFIAFLPQLDVLFNMGIQTRFRFSMESLSFFTTMQGILGFWIVSFVNVFKSINIRRGHVIRSIKFMG